MKIFNFNSVTARYVKFKIVSWRAWGGGLQYFNIMKSGNEYGFIFNIYILQHVFNAGCYKDCTGGTRIWPKGHIKNDMTGMTPAKCRKICFDENKFLFGKFREGGTSRKSLYIKPFHPPQRCSHIMYNTKVLFFNWFNEGYVRVGRWSDEYQVVRQMSG